VRLRKKPWINEAIQEYATVLAEPGHVSNQESLFGKSAPLHVELGTGRGRFICEMSAANPENNYLGIEVQKDVIYYAAQKAFERNLPNLRLLIFNVNEIQELFAAGEISRLYINFCDPWPKNRHAKRRLTHRRFLEMYRRILVPGGDLCFKTDNEQLFEFSLNEFSAAGLRLQNITFDLHNSGFAGNIMTEYEAKFSAKGMKIFRCEARFI
jgi:tRNA (guanine-N7-)-methyltransferase